MPYFRKRNKKPIKNDGYEPNAPQEQQEISVASLALGDNTKAVLDKGKLATLGDILKRTEREMFKIQGFGRKNLDDVKRMLEGFKLSLKPDDRQNKPLGDKAGDSKQPHPQQQGNNGKGGAIKAEQLPKEDKKRSNVPGTPEEWEKFSSGTKWGFRDLIGKVAIEPLYDEIFRFKEDYACFEKQGEFGYINSKGEVVIEPQYECAMSFSEGLASVTKDGKCGYIDKDGKVVINFRFDTATAFEEGTARVKLDGAWNIIDKEGKLKVIG